MRIIVGLLMVGLVGCSAPPAKDTKTDKGGPSSAVPTKKHPLNKYVELAGFRLSEAGAGQLKIKFVVINHSDADIGDLGLKVRLDTIGEFESKVASLGPQEIREVTATVPTKLRIYELPDWQFTKAEFEITSPAQ